MIRILAVLLAVVCLWTTSVAGTQAMGIVGGPKDIPNFANSVEIDELANFAVDQYRTRQVFSSQPELQSCDEWMRFACWSGVLGFGRV